MRTCQIHTSLVETSEDCLQAFPSFSKHVFELVYFVFEFLVEFGATSKISRLEVLRCLARCLKKSFDERLDVCMSLEL